MAENLSDVSAVDALMKRGKTTMNSKWTDGVPDYASEYSLTAEHIPALIEAATNWVESSSDDHEVYGQVHAWRALGQMRAVEAVQPLLDVQDELDELKDGWYLEEFHHARWCLLSRLAVEPSIHVFRESVERPCLASFQRCRQSRRFPERLL